ncbi:DNA cytosine methyltransferase, partial [Candidatus Pacearchaeota archaeon]|nr:DNA cytosine methyltransferase [Candidatus Pacearchaeota archaeon]
FVVGFREKAAAKKFEGLLTKSVNTDPDSMLSKEQKATQCLNARGRSGVSIYQDFVYEGPARGLRSHTHAERESLQGWPPGWTGGVPHSARERMTGNGVTADVAKYVGSLVKKVLVETVKAD